MEDPRRPDGWYGLPPWMRGLTILGAALAVLAVPFYFLFRNDRMARNEKAASAALKALASAEADFRGNDRDGNGIQDFWTGDVAGLVARTASPIDVRIAAADGRAAGPTPYYGYYFLAMRPAEPGQRRKFAFCAYPATAGVTGRYTFVINENNALHKLDLKGQPVEVWPPHLPSGPTYSREPD